MNILAIALLMAGCATAASDPLCGTWKANVAKSKLTGEEMIIQDLGGNKFKFDYGSTSDVLLANGTDQPVRFGTTRSLTQNAPDRWTTVRKKDGRVLGVGKWTVSMDNKSLIVLLKNTNEDGTAVELSSTYTRISGSQGLPGTWKEINFQTAAQFTMVIAPFGDNGLMISNPESKSMLKINFDGKEYTSEGPRETTEITTSGKRMNAHTLKFIDKSLDGRC